MIVDVNRPPSLIAGRYETGEVLGRGGMGEVRAARDLRLGRDVAVKVLSPEVASRPTMRERFEAEAKAAARLNHPNVVAVYDSGVDEGVPFLVMERLPGPTLADEMAKGQVGVERAKAVACDVLAALGAAHRAGVVHRDMKPGNVLLCGDGRAKVADFGIAKTIESMDLTTTGIIVGTPGYLAPELIAGQAATPRSDLYSVGVLLYESLSGRKPFDAESPLALAHAIQNQRPEPLRELRPDVPEGVVAVVERAMEKDPRRRFADASEMARVLGQTPAPAGAAATQALGWTRAFGSATLRRAWQTVERLGARPGRTRRFPIALLVAVAALVFILVALTARDSSDPGAGPTQTSRPSPTASMPAGLDRALDALEEAVRP